MRKALKKGDHRVKHFYENSPLSSFTSAPPELCPLSTHKEMTSA